MPLNDTPKPDKSDTMDISLVALATARLTRFVTTDSLGEWLIRKPAYRWAKYDPEYAPEEGNRRQEIVSGLDCPYCVGTWVGYSVLASWGLARHNKNTHRAWRFVAGGLALNYVIGHVSSRID